MVDSHLDIEKQKKYDQMKKKYLEISKSIPTEKEILPASNAQVDIKKVINIMCLTNFINLKIYSIVKSIKS